MGTFVPSKWLNSYKPALLQVHHDLAKYHEMGRFILPGSDDSRDLDAALFHEQQAAELGIKEAVVTMANIYLQRSRDVLANITVDVSNQHRDCVYSVMWCEFKNC